MLTRLTIGVILATVFLVALGVLVGLVWWWGSLGAVVFALLAGTMVAVYRLAIRPWHLRWGATDDEITRVMPGDDLISGVDSATRAITIHASVEDVWPWLMQLGYSRAGWYSYDWIDNDFHRSADHIVPEYQSLSVGDRILMAPGMGLSVVAIDPFNALVCLMDDGSASWCLALYEGEATRLVSRWRPRLKVPLVARAIIEPGAFIMEQKMLRTIRDRVERRVGGRLN